MRPRISWTYAPVVVALAGCVDVTPPAILGACKGDACPSADLADGGDDMDAPELTDASGTPDGLAALDTSAVAEAGAAPRDAATDAPDGQTRVPDTGPPLLAPGEECVSNTECASHFCVDGVCCNTLCNGTCQACNLGSAAGTCTPIAAGDDPADECAKDDATSCKRDGTCDGHGACRQYVQGTECAPSTCTGTSYTAPRTCDGMGSCAAAQTASCGGYQCGPTGTCRTTCTGNGDCVAPSLCLTGKCTGPKPPGQTCAMASECASGFCQQGVCCATACTGTCRSCALPTSAGTCTAIPAGQDPQNECTDAGIATCGTDGTCDGAGKCRLYAAGKTCVAAMCSTDGSAVPARTCDGAGVCRPATARACQPYACVDAGCKKRCNKPTDCAAGYTCSGSTCVGP